MVGALEPIRVMQSKPGDLRAHTGLAKYRERKWGMVRSFGSFDSQMNVPVPFHLQIFMTSDFPGIPGHFFATPGEC